MMKKEEKKVFPSAASSRGDSAAGTDLRTAGGSCLAAEKMTVFTLRKPVIKGGMSPSSGTAAAAVVHLSAPPPTIQKGRCGGAEEAAAKRLSVADRVTERSLPGVSCGFANADDVASLKGVRVTYGSIHSSSNNSATGVDCKRKLSACSHGDKLEALRRAREKLVWKGCAIGGTSSSKGSNAGAGSSVSTTVRRGGKVAKKTMKGLLRPTKRQTATSPARHRRSTRKTRGSRTGTRKRRKRKCRRRQLTTAQREARRACLLREVRISPQLLDLLLHTSGAAEVVHRQRHQQARPGGGDASHDELRPHEKAQNEQKKEEKQEVNGEGGQGLGEQGRRETGEAQPLHRQITREELTVRMSRPAVTKKIWQYVREQQLVMESDGCTVHADKRLQQLFGGRIRVNLFKELQSLLVPHLLFYEDTETPVPAAEDPETDDEQTHEEDGEEENEDSSGSGRDTEKSEAEEDDTSTVASQCKSDRLNGYDGRCTDTCAKSRRRSRKDEAGGAMEFSHAKEEFDPSVACKSGTATVVERTAIAVEAGATVGCSEGTGRYAGKECLEPVRDDKKGQLKSSSSSLGGSSTQTEEQRSRPHGRPAPVKRLRRARCLSRSGSSSSSSSSDSSTSSDTSRSEDDSSSSSSGSEGSSSSEGNRTSSRRSASPLRPPRRSRKRLIKEVSESSGNERVVCDRDGSPGGSRGGNNRSSGRTSCKNSRTAHTDTEQSRCADTRAPRLSPLDATAATRSRRGSGSSDAASSDSDEGRTSCKNESPRRRRRDPGDAYGSSSVNNRISPCNSPNGRSDSCRSSDGHREGTNTVNCRGGSRGERTRLLFVCPGDGTERILSAARTDAAPPAGIHISIPRPASVTAEPPVGCSPNSAMSVGHQIPPFDSSNSNSLNFSRTSSRRDSHRAVEEKRETVLAVNNAVKDERVSLSGTEAGNATGSAGTAAEPRRLATGTTGAWTLRSADSGLLATESTAHAKNAAANATACINTRCIQFEQHRSSVTVRPHQNADEVTVDTLQQKVKQDDEQVEAAAGVAAESKAGSSGGSDNTVSSGGLFLPKCEKKSPEEIHDEKDAAAPPAVTKQWLLRLRDFLFACNKCECHHTRQRRDTCISPTVAASSAVYAFPSAGVTISPDHTSDMSCSLSAKNSYARGEKAHSDGGAICTRQAHAPDRFIRCLWCRSCWECCIKFPDGTPSYVGTATSVRTVSRLSALVQLLPLNILPSSFTVSFEARPSRRLAAAVLRGMVQFYVSVYPCSDNTGSKDKTVCSCSHSMSEGGSSSGNSTCSSSSTSNAGTVSSSSDREKSSRSETCSTSEKTGNSEHVSSSSTEEKGFSSSSRQAYVSMATSTNDRLTSSSEGGEKSYAPYGCTDARADSNSSDESESQRDDHASDACCGTTYECDSSTGGKASGDKARWSGNGVCSRVEVIRAPNCSSTGSSGNSVFAAAQVDDDSCVDTALTAEESRANSALYLQCETSASLALPTSKTEEAQQGAVSRGAWAAAPARMTRGGSKPDNGDLTPLWPLYSPCTQPSIEAQEGGNNYTSHSVADCTVDRSLPSNDSTPANKTHANNFASPGTSTCNGSRADVVDGSSCDTSAHIAAPARPAEKPPNACSFHERHLRLHRRSSVGKHVYTYKNITNAAVCRWAASLYMLSRSCRQTYDKPIRVQLNMSICLPVLDFPFVRDGVRVQRATVSVDRVLPDDVGFRLRGRCDIKDLSPAADYRIILHAVLVGVGRKDAVNPSQASTVASQLHISAAGTGVVGTTAAAAERGSASTAKSGERRFSSVVSERVTNRCEDEPLLQATAGTPVAPGIAGMACSEPRAEAGETFADSGVAAACTGGATKAGIEVGTEAWEVAPADATRLTGREGVEIFDEVSEEPVDLPSAGKKERNCAPQSVERRAQPSVVRAECVSAMMHRADVGNQQQQTRRVSPSEAEQQEQVSQRRTEATQKQIVPLQQHWQKEPKPQAPPCEGEQLTQAHFPGKQNECQRHNSFSAQAETTREGDGDTPNQELIVVVVADAFVMQRAQPLNWNALQTTVFLQSLEVPHLAAAAEACQLQGRELMEVSDADLLSLGVQGPVLRRRVLMAIARLKEQAQSAAVSAAGGDTIVTAG